MHTIFFVKLYNIKFHDNPFSGSQSIMRTNGHREANRNIFATFHCEREKN
jgi:hypothetical protein